MSYIDTSVIIAALDQSDPRQRLAREALEKRENKKVSELVLIELASILAKRDETLSQVSRKIDARRELTLSVVILYIMRRFKLNYRKVDGFKRIFAIGNLYPPFATAMDISPRFKLKTLDLLHLSYVKTLIEQGEEINELITVDEDFGRMKELITRELNVEVKTLKI
ncbi:MAG: PIN domain-containing protein [Candidatus Bathyarchaeia archaeon]